MAKQGVETKDGIPVRCEYCHYNLGENLRFRYMWHCSHLSFCVVFGQRYCQAKKLGKGDFLLDKTKYEQWKRLNSEK